MNVTAQMVKELRDRTGAGMMDCKKALQETEGEVDKAIDLLRTKGLAAAAKKASRAAAEGLVASYIHAGGKIGVLLEVNCETDFVARTDDFQSLARDLAMHIAASDPRFVRREEVSDEILAQERDVYKGQALESGKPAEIIDRIVDGKMEKFYSEQVLLEQPFVKDPDKSVGELVTEAVAKLGENIQVRRYARFNLGEGLARREDNFVAEVAEQLG